MKSKLSKKIMLGTLALAFVGISAIDADAQTFTNTGAGVYNATCGAKLRLKSTSSAVPADFITENSTLDPKQGEANNPIPGIVEWAGSTGTQNVTAHYYTLLLLSGLSTKTVADGVHIVPTGCATMDENGTTGGDYAYVVVDGSGTVTDNQIIFDGTTTLQPTNGSNAEYEDIVINEPINIEGGSTTTTVKKITGDSNGDVAIPDGGNLSLTGTDSDLDGSITIATGGTLTLGSGSDLTLSGTGNTNSGTINADCGSTITYDGAAQNIMAAADANTTGKGQYGKLILSGSSPKAAGNIDVCNDFTLNGDNNTLAMGTGTDAYTLTMLNSAQAQSGGTAAVVTYGDGAEVVGQMAWNNMGTTERTFNNANTKVAITDGNGTSLTLYSQPGIAPTGYAATTDVNRKVSVVSAENVTGFDIAIGYVQSETTGITSFAQSKARFYDDGDASKKLAAAYDNTTAYVTKGTGLTIGSGFGDYTLNDDIVIRVKENVDLFAINDGRWTNVNVWDEKRIPTADDNVFIMANVYAGINNSTGNFVGSANAGTEGNAEGTYNDIKESDKYNGVAVAKTITIPQPAYSDEHYGLIIGNEDNAANYVFTVAGLFNNENTFTNAAPIAWSDNGNGFGQKSDRTSSILQGLWIMGSNYTATNSTATISVKQIENVGEVNNEGLIEIQE